MAEKPNVQFFKDHGYAGVDSRHIALRVYPVTDTANGQLVTKHKVFIQDGAGNFKAYMPTDFVFGVMDDDWVFEPFEQNGKTWPGLSINPDHGDVTVSSPDPTMRTVVMHDKCEKYWMHYYQIVLKNTVTGEIATTDPSLGNGDSDPPGGGGTPLPPPPPPPPPGGG